MQMQIKAKIQMQIHTQKYRPVAIGQNFKTTLTRFAIKCAKAHTVLIHCTCGEVTNLEAAGILSA